LQGRLRASGLRSTYARRAVLGVLDSAARPMSHSEVVTALGDIGIDRATLYRNLLDLTQGGLVRRSDPGDRVWRFQSHGGAAAHEGHPHFTCVECGTVACLPQSSILVGRGRGIPRSMLRAAEIQVRGVCDGCAREA
jgi:Fur family ferric uptake transcriptional regulator